MSFNVAVPERGGLRESCTSNPFTCQVLSWVAAIAVFRLRSPFIILQRTLPAGWRLVGLAEASQLLWRLPHGTVMELAVWSASFTSSTLYLSVQRCISWSNCSFFSLFTALSCFSVSPGFDHFLPWMYFIYLSMALLHRTKRDDEKCHKKYNDLWEKYKKMVPHCMIPFIYWNAWYGMWGIVMSICPCHLAWNAMNVCEGVQTACHWSTNHKLNALALCLN